MRTQSHHRAAALISALLLVFALSALITATAQAAPALTQLQRVHPDFNAHFVAFGTTPGRTGRALGGPLRGRGALIGRGVLAPGGAPATGTSPWVAGGILAALLVGGSAALAAASERSKGQSASVTQLRSAGANAPPAEAERSQRKAA
jgi:hypothetical protein